MISRIGGSPAAASSCRESLPTERGTTTGVPRHGAALFLLGDAGYGEGVRGIIEVAAAVVISRIIGNILGYLSEKVTAAVVKTRSSRDH